MSTNIYIFKLEGKCYYFGKSNNVDKRFHRYKNKKDFFYM